MKVERGGFRGRLSAFLQKAMAGAAKNTPAGTDGRGARAVSRAQSGARAAPPRYARPRPRAHARAITRETGTPLYLLQRFSRFGVKTLFGHSFDLHRSSAGWPLASPERGARRGSQWPGAVRQNFLPLWRSRPPRTGRAKGSGATKDTLRRERLGRTCASIPGRDGRPVGRLRLERQYRDRQASWRPVGTRTRRESHGHV